jgi:hypothetical protein
MLRFLRGDAGFEEVAIDFLRFTHRGCRSRPMPAKRRLSGR